MQRLEGKTIHGRTYYYLSQWGWKNGKCRRLSQKYLGKPEDIAKVAVFLASDESSFCTGGVYMVDGGISAG